VGGRAELQETERQRVRETERLDSVTCACTVAPPAQLLELHTSHTIPTHEHSLTLRATFGRRVPLHMYMQLREQIFRLQQKYVPVTLSW